MGLNNLSVLGQLNPITNNRVAGTSAYLLNDRFLTDVAAGSVNGTSAEPTGGVRTVTDTNSKISITSGALSFATGGAANDGVWYPLQTRLSGKSFLLDLTNANTSSLAQIGLDQNTSGSITDMIRFLTSGSLALVQNGGSSIVVGLYTASSYKIALVMRSTGFFAFIKGDAFTNWNLLWISSLGNANVYPAITTSSTTGIFTADNLRIPTQLWLPQPVAYDTFTRSNGALGSTEALGPDSQTLTPKDWTGNTWSISSNAAINTPVTLGDELLADGGLENWASATDLEDWTETIAGTSSVNRDATEQHSGTYCARMDIDASNSACTIDKLLAPGSHKWMYFSMWMKSSASGRTGAISTTYYPNGVTLDPGTTWTQYVNTLRTTTVNPTLWAVKRIGATSASLYFDDLSLVELSISELISSVSTSTKDVIADVNVTQTGVNGTQAGICVNLDSAANPLNFIIAYLDGYGNAKLAKCVAGAYTDVISASVTYSAGATLRVIKSGTSYSLYYNNAQVGSTSTISDAGIVSNKNHGLFSTYSGNTLDNFTIFPRGTSGEHNGLNNF